MIIRIEPETKEKLTRLARLEGKTTSQKIRELVENYIQERDIGAYIDDLWERTGNKLKIRGVSTSDISRAVRDSRKGKR
jgi:predicted DNA-binding protein